MHDAAIPGDPGGTALENHMRKGALLIALAFALAATTSASAAKKPAADPAIQAQKDQAAFLNDAFHPWAPTAKMSKPSKGKKKK
jgi:hypothetical protein